MEAGSKIKNPPKPLPVSDVEFLSNPDIILRYWLKTNHGKIYHNENQRDWDLFVHADQTVEIRNWKVPGVSKPTIDEIKTAVSSLATAEADTDLKPLEGFSFSDDMLKKILYKMYQIENTGKNPTRAQFNAYVLAISKINLFPSKN